MKLLKKILRLNVLCIAFAPYCSAQLNTIAQPAIPPHSFVIDVRECLPPEDQKNVEFYRTFINGFFTVDLPNKTVTSTLGKKHCYSFDDAFKLLGNVVNGIEITPNTNRLHNLIALLTRRSMPNNTTHEHCYYGDLLTILRMINSPYVLNSVHYLTKLRINFLINFEYPSALAACIPTTDEELYGNGFTFQLDFTRAYLGLKGNFDSHAGNKV